ncbi:uncharacterized protein LOC62_02G003468 [Vanrija pseudolonga]|uniref:Uncharacterized protein n=1 Tax=Vanrija pseudolonga TaxID=143232 RepID=A0AAF0Y8A2_9TREE|nr:hypothetical protein LOC62_02G003468 [Vanrija pseudolonga]
MTSDPAEPEETPPAFVVFFPFLIGVSFFFSMLSKRHEEKTPDDESGDDSAPPTPSPRPRWTSRMVLMPGRPPR